MPGPLGGKATIGQLRHRVRIETPVETLNEYGERVQSWAEVATVWAKVESVSAADAMQGDTVQVDCTHLVTMRPRAVTGKMRLVWVVGDLTLNILGDVPMVGSGNWLVLPCKREG